MRRPARISAPVGTRERPQRTAHTSATIRRRLLASIALWFDNGRYSRGTPFGSPPRDDPARAFRLAPLDYLLGRAALQVSAEWTRMLGSERLTHGPRLSSLASRSQLDPAVSESNFSGGGDVDRCRVSSDTDLIGSIHVAHTGADGPQESCGTLKLLIGSVVALCQVRSGCGRARRALVDSALYISDTQQTCATCRSLLSDGFHWVRISRTHNPRLP
jgi:hypothetical protein